MALLPDDLTPEQWDRATQIGAKTLLSAMSDRINRRLERNADPREYVALLTGALVQLAELMRASLEDRSPENLRMAEDYLVAYVRGVMRDLDGPVNEDGSRYGDW